MADPDAPILAEWAASLCEHLRNNTSAKLDSAIPTILAPATERHLRGIIDLAIKVQRRARRTTLTVDDINFARALSKQEVSSCDQN
jgi:histone H3/H4